MDRVILQTLKGPRLFKKFPEFYEAEGSLPHSQDPPPVLILSSPRPFQHLEDSF